VLRVSRGGMPVRGWLGLSVALLAAAFGGCGSDCPLIRQSFVVVAPDSALQTLVDPCVAGQPAPGEYCPPPPAGHSAAIGCGCLPLCRRLIEISDQFPGVEEITECRANSVESLPVTKQTEQAVVNVLIAYRPTSCQ
jgi:hypothetical protein